MVYDVITFNGELEILEIRLNILDSVVDKFVIVEATKTFSGHEKPLYYKDNLDMYEKWNDKIIYHVIDRYDDPDVYYMAYNSSNTGNKEYHWMMEFIQKEMIKDALKGLDDEDIVFVSDADEIWDPNVLKSAIRFDNVYKPIQNLCYIYYLNQRTNENWHAFTGTIVTKYKNIKDACLNHLRTHSKNNYVFIDQGGWHFNALGGMHKKIEGFKHPVYIEQYMKTRENGARVDEGGLPQYLLENKDKYKHLFL